MGSFRDLIVYQKAFKLAMDLFRLSKQFPKEERFDLTDQIRRSSRGVCTNLAEAYRKRRYKAAFIAKLTDSDAENTETQVHLDFAVACGYATQDEVTPLLAASEEVGVMLNSMMENPDKWTLKPKQ
jgi:four helix bundle protein